MIKIDFKSKAATLANLTIFFNWMQESDDERVKNFRDKKTAVNRVKEAIDGVDDFGGYELPKEVAEFITVDGEAAEKEKKSKPKRVAKPTVKVLTSRERFIVSLVSNSKSPMKVSDIAKAIKGKPGKCLDLAIESLTDGKVLVVDDDGLITLSDSPDVKALTDSCKAFQKAKLDWSAKEDFPEKIQRKYCGMKIRVLKEHTRKKGFGLSLWENGIIGDDVAYEDFILGGGKNRTIKYEERQGTIEMVPLV